MGCRRKQTQIVKDADVFSDVAPASRKSSIFLRRIVGAMFMRVNSKCAHRVRPPLSRINGVRELTCS
jgi:hypothetical protein